MTEHGFCPYKQKSETRPCYDNLSLDVSLRVCVKLCLDYVVETARLHAYLLTLFFI